MFWRPFRSIRTAFAIAAVAVLMCAGRPAAALAQSSPADTRLALRARLAARNAVRARSLVPLVVNGSPVWRPEAFARAPRGNSLTGTPRIGDHWAEPRADSPAGSLARAAGSLARFRQEVAERLALSTGVRFSFSTRDELANFHSKRTIKHVQPSLRETSTRRYRVAVSIDF